MKQTSTRPHFPSKDDIVAFIGRQPGKVGTREIARAFGLKNNLRADLKRLLRELADEGQIEKRRKKLHHAGALPETILADITGRDSGGELIATPDEWDEETSGPAPKISVHAPRRTRDRDAAAGVGDRVLLRVEETGDAGAPYRGRVIRVPHGTYGKRPAQDAPRRAGGGGGEGRVYRIEPDASNASYFWAIGALVPGSKVTVEGLGKGSLQGDVGVVDVLAEMGAGVVYGRDFVTVMAPPAGTLRAVERDMNGIPDMVQTIAVGDHPEGIQADPAGANVYVACWFDNVLMRIDAAQMTVTGDAAVGDGPRAFGLFLR